MSGPQFQVCLLQCPLDSPAYPLPSPHLLPLGALHPCALPGCLALWQLCVTAQGLEPRISHSCCPAGCVTAEIELRKTLLSEVQESVPPSPEARRRLGSHLAQCAPRWWWCLEAEGWPAGVAAQTVTVLRNEKDDCVDIQGSKRTGLSPASY